MPSYDLEGKIKVIDNIQTFDSGFQKREFVVTTDLTTEYPQDIKLELVKDKCDILDEYNEGDEVKCSFNMRGNEYNDKYYVNLTCWRMKKSSDGEEVKEPTSADNAPADSDDDLPF